MALPSAFPMRTDFAEKIFRRLSFSSSGERQKSVGQAEQAIVFFGFQFSVSLLPPRHTPKYKARRFAVKS